MLTPLLEAVKSFNRNKRHVSSQLFDLMREKKEQMRIMHMSKTYIEPIIDFPLSAYMFRLVKRLNEEISL